MKLLVLVFQLMTVFQMSRTVTKQKHFTGSHRYIPTIHRHNLKCNGSRYFDFF